MTAPLLWQLGTLTAVRPETPTVKTFSFSLPKWQPHLAGQHVDVRLTAPDGYQAQRSYSIASDPTRTGSIDLTVERIEDGEVSDFLHDVAMIGDRIELRGPIGGYFVWEAPLGGPLLLVAGGSGVVPLMAMLPRTGQCRIAGPDGSCSVRAAARTSSISTSWRRCGRPIRRFTSSTR